MKTNVLWLAGFMAVLAFAEGLAPLRMSRKNRWRRWGVNAVISLGVYANVFWVLKPAETVSLELSSDRTIGILNWFHADSFLKYLVAVLTFDFTFYCWHRANHLIPFLWRFHAVHHSDPDMDITTTFRFHFGEVALSSGVRALQIFMIGVSPEILLLVEFLHQLSTMFHHSNLRLPMGLEKWLQFFWITPRLHHIHHSQEKRDMESNYGVFVPWWDLVFRSFKNIKEASSEQKMGVSGYNADSDNTLAALFLAPFKKQKPYFVR